MNATLDAWNQMNEQAAAATLMHCCSSSRWASALAAKRPLATVDDLFHAADNEWSSMQEADWLEAFQAHPRIGEGTAKHATPQSSAWSRQEQASAVSAQDQTIIQLAELNQQYETTFAFTYIVCATGKTAEEMLAILKRRLVNNRQQELIEAAEQQRQIMQIRLRKWLEV